MEEDVQPVPAPQGSTVKPQADADLIMPALDIVVDPTIIPVLG